MLFYENQILNPKLAPNWFTNVKVIEIKPIQGGKWDRPFENGYILLIYNIYFKLRWINFVYFF